MKGSHNNSNVVVVLPIEKVKEDPRNEMIHPELEMASLRASLRLYGQQRPILIDSKIICIAGNGVLKAAREIGMLTIECERSQLKGARRDAYKFADNWLARLSFLDEEIMRANIVKMRERDGASFDPEALGISDDHLQRLLHPAEWDGRLIDPDLIAGYDARNETFVIKVDRVQRAEAETVAGMLRSAISDLPYEVTIH
jgi:hypothetical protein